MATNLYHASSASLPFLHSLNFGSRCHGSWWIDDWRTRPIHERRKMFPMQTEGKHVSQLCNPSLNIAKGSSSNFRKPTTPYKAIMPPPTKARNAAHKVHIIMTGLHDQEQYQCLDLLKDSLWKPLVHQTLIWNQCTLIPQLLMEIKVLKRKC